MPKLFSLTCSGGVRPCVGVQRRGHHLRNEAGFTSQFCCQHISKSSFRVHNVGSDTVQRRALDYRGYCDYYLRGSIVQTLTAGD